MEEEELEEEEEEEEVVMVVAWQVAWLGRKQRAAGNQDRRSPLPRQPHHLPLLTSFFPSVAFS